MLQHQYIQSLPLGFFLIAARSAFARWEVSAPRMAIYRKRYAQSAVSTEFAYGEGRRCSYVCDQRSQSRSHRIEKQTVTRMVCSPLRIRRCSLPFLSVLQNYPCLQQCIFDLNIKFGKAKQKAIAFVATTLITLLAVTEANVRLSRRKLNTGNVYDLFLSALVHISPIKI